MVRCPICNKRYSLNDKCGKEKLEYYPFCSERCKLIDLGAWLDADYVIPSRLNVVEPDISE
jgi:endogenous inhibitor of DNA gyrase (YacG/DUF329 family)